jgi:AraC family ethanolamine operon transcriptional activator
MAVEHRIFHTGEAAAEALGALWRADIVQMDAGPMRIDVRTAIVGRCGLTELTTTRQLLSSGERRRDLLTVTPITEASAGALFRGRELKPGTLLVLDPGGEAIQQVPAGHSQMALSIPLSLFRRLAGVEHGDDGEQFLRWQVVQPSTLAYRRFLDAMRRPLRSPARGSGGKDADVRLASLLLSALAGAESTRDSTSAVRRRSIARQAEELMRADPSKPPSVLELCEAVGTSRRTLFYAFQELYGVSPSAFLKTLRLHEARRAIRTGVGHGGIQLMAQALGFRHPGQFAIDYARAFGESPSMTARRSSRSPSR